MGSRTLQNAIIFLSYCNRILLLVVKVRSVSLEDSNFKNRGQTGRRVIFFNPPSPHQQKKQIRLYDSTTSPRSEINHPSLPVCANKKVELRAEMMQLKIILFRFPTKLTHATCDMCNTLEKAAQTSCLPRTWSHAEQLIGGLVGNFNPKN